jgi:large subunit ribosomal protein L29
MKRAELIELSKEQLEHKLAELHEESFKLHMRRGTEELRNPLRLRSLRRDVARVLTLLREEELGRRKLVTEAGKDGK